MKGIRTPFVLMTVLLLAEAVFGGEKVILQQVRGDVAIRIGVAEMWNKAVSGEMLNPDATIKTGKKSSAVILLPSDGNKILLPSEVMMEISDLRELTREELMLKLTMEKVRASSYEWKNKELNIPRTTVVHGDAKGAKKLATITDIEAGVFQLNGTRVLFDNGYYSTSALRTLDVLRRYPSLGEVFDHRMLGAQALEKANLTSEALNEYVLISQLPTLTQEQHQVLQLRISQLRQQ